ncbi:hypothetical protein TW65_00986 [Stemphylium lycopersici]|uniref:Uncharacterized protein n=1 Tax=Stemphylium lycopersici TaxID=183478 RepID=A0A364N6E6_STELY|nr:hypothetical protein TW65_00986 [Stemphylium lycopersici]RAR12836.1 hypothetical protein DDE83_003755 [Stemphylium lycopersici]
MANNLPTPPASSAAPSQHASPLPQPRKHPLKPGGPRESDLIRYLDHGVNRIQKRVDNRMTNRKLQPVPGEEEGYKAYWEVAKDLDGLVDVVWVSASPNLQIPYLLNLAVLTADFLPLFGSTTRSTQATFRLVSKLDYAFSSLLTGHDTATGDLLAGFEGGRRVTTTDKVRLKGIVDRTRLAVARVTSGESVVGDEEDVGEAMDTDTEGEGEGEGEAEAGGRDGTVTFEGFEDNTDDEEDDGWEERGVASVYEKTIGELGDVLGGPPIGIITDDWNVNRTEQQKSGGGFVEPGGEVDMLPPSQVVPDSVLWAHCDAHGTGMQEQWFWKVRGCLPRRQVHHYLSPFLLPPPSMPTYLARGVSARLGAMPLADTVSPSIILRKGEAAKQQSDTAESQLRGSKMLKEVPVPFPGDEEQYRLNWLDNAPFMQVQAGQDLFAATDPTTPPEAKALVLHVNLSDRTYVSGLRNQKTSLKIDIFFNGQLSSCWFMSTHDLKSGVRGHHQVFAGTRVDFLAERPWIILPPGVAPDGSLRKGNASVSVEQRWRDICQALQGEARERGTNSEAEVPPTAKFLDALATMHMPDRVRDMQTSAGSAFGTIDIVITAGEGKKLTSGVGYLKAPKRMLDENFPLAVGIDSATTNPRPDGLQRDKNDTKHHHHEPSLDNTDVDAEDGSGPEYDPPSKRQALISSGPSTQQTGETTHSQTCIISQPKLQCPKSQSDSSSFTTTSGQHTVTPPSMVASSVNPINMLPSPRQRVDGFTSSHSNYQMPLSNAASHSDPTDPSSVSFPGPSHHYMFPFAERIGVDLARYGSRAYTTPFSATGQTHRGSFNIHSSSPVYYPFGLGTQLSGNPACPSSVPTMLPNPLGYYGNDSPFLPFPRLKYQPLRPLPPAALYSVPTKPKRSISPQKGRVTMDAKRNAGSTLVSRVVIFGQDKSILFDRQWNPPRRISTESKGHQRLRVRCDSPEDVENAARSAKHKGMSTDLFKFEKIADNANISSVILPAGCANAALSSTVVEQDTSTMVRFHNPGEPTRSSARVTNETPARRTPSWNSIRGVEGPKANPFWFENPEDMLREASARQRRSRLPNKRYNRPAAEPQPISNEKPFRDCSLLTGVTSSPLSSLHTTPEPDVEPLPGDRQFKSMSSSVAAPILQADGSDERQRFRSLNPLARTPSPKKRQSTTVTPGTKHYAKSTPQSSVCRKRKAPHRTVTKEPRSPNRLKTCDNPVLNRNCVIAYAESKNSGEKQGILRQVRSERQGVFQEEYVVFAARFFVGEQ